MTKKCVIVMGVCGSGKTSVGLALADHFKCRFIDGDDLHPRANIDKMASGHPLNDEDREPWLTRINDVVYSLKNRSAGGVIVCSALKKKYRDIIRRNDNVCFVHLHGTYETILERMRKRSGHYMKEDMVKSQFDTLQFPGEDETDVKNIDITPPLDEVIAKSIEAVKELDDAK